MTMSDDVNRLKPALERVAMFCPHCLCAVPIPPRPPQPVTAAMEMTCFSCEMKFRGIVFREIQQLA